MTGVQTCALPICFPVTISPADLILKRVSRLDADMIMMVHRQEKYDEEDAEWQGKAEIIVTKSRNGKTGTSLVGFDGSTFRFYELNNQWGKAL